MERGMRDKKGIADIIVTVIIVGLSLAAIVIVWAVVSGLINQESNSINIQGKCGGITLDVLSMNCTLGAPNPQNCSVSLERTGTDQSVISGVKLVFRNSSTVSPVIDIPGDLAKLAGKVVNVNSTINSANSVDVTAYFNDKTNVPQYCLQTYTFP